MLLGCLLIIIGLAFMSVDVVLLDQFTEKIDQKQAQIKINEVTQKSINKYDALKEQMNNKMFIKNPDNTYTPPSGFSIEDAQYIEKATESSNQILDLINLRKEQKKSYENRSTNKQEVQDSLIYIYNAVQPPYDIANSSYIELNNSENALLLRDPSKNIKSFNDCDNLIKTGSSLPTSTPQDMTTFWGSANFSALSNLVNSNNNLKIVDNTLSFISNYQLNDFYQMTSIFTNILAKNVKITPYFMYFEINNTKNIFFKIQDANDYTLSHMQHQISNQTPEFISSFLSIISNDKITIADRLLMNQNYTKINETWSCHYYQSEFICVNKERTTMFFYSQIYDLFIYFDLDSSFKILNCYIFRAGILYKIPNMVYLQNLASVLTYNNNGAITMQNSTYNGFQELTNSKGYTLSYFGFQTDLSEIRFDFAVDGVSISVNTSLQSTSDNKVLFIKSGTNYNFLIMNTNGIVIKRYNRNGVNINEQSAMLFAN
jgi:hypothetical protein